MTRAEARIEAIEDVFRVFAARAGLAIRAPRRAKAAMLLADAWPLPEEALGAASEGALDPTERRAGGVHYTPHALVDRVVERAFDQADGEPGSLRVLDPAMGAGAFLCAALRAIVRRSGSDTTAARRDVAMRCVFGIDLDPAAVHAARRALWLSVGDPSLPIDVFDDHLVVADALLDKRLGARAGGAWRTLFPSVFDRSPAGFDVVLGNPPFLGGKRIRTVHGDAYAEHLVRLHGTSKNVDLAAHFVRRGFDGLRAGGTLGFVTTNTIAQGDTREGGLAHVLRSGGTLYAAEREVEWPGRAGVVTSLVWIKKGPCDVPATLDGRPVGSIDPFLSPLGQQRDPRRLPAMKQRAFIGCFLRGSGFVIEEETVRAVVKARPESAEIIKPFMGGEEVMQHPEHRPHRFVIHFGDRPLGEATKHPELLAILREKVRPFRESKRSTKADEAHRAIWWRFANHRPELVRRTRDLKRVIGIPRVAGHLVAVMLEAGVVHSDQLVIVASDSFAVLALLSSRVHRAWAKLTCSTLGSGMRYTPSDAFETFPIPFESFEALERDSGLIAVGEAFSRERASMLRARGVGLSKLLRCPSDDPSLNALRERQGELDRAVVGAYGWDEHFSEEIILRQLLELNER